MRWYTERQNLKQTQANRSSSAARAQSILKTLNTSFYGSPPAVDQVEVDPEAELSAFDRKIYAVQQDMESAMSAELKALGVPFFGTDRTLVMADGEDPSKAKLPVVAGLGGSAGGASPARRACSRWPRCCR